MSGKVVTGRQSWRDKPVFQYSISARVCQSRGARPAGLYAGLLRGGAYARIVPMEPALPQVSGASTLTSLTESLLRDYDSLVARSSSGLRSCKEVHAFLKERATIEATYGNALVRQARASAGSLERGTCRMGWFAFKSETESIGRKHLVRPPPALDVSPAASSRPSLPTATGAGLALQHGLHGAPVPARPPRRRAPHSRRRGRRPAARPPLHPG